MDKERVNGKPSSTTGLFYTLRILRLVPRKKGWMLQN